MFFDVAAFIIGFKIPDRYTNPSHILYKHYQGPSLSFGSEHQLGCSQKPIQNHNAKNYYGVTCYLM